MTSRADPAMIFDAAPGELFTVRNVAALAPPYDESGGLHGVSAALEFALTRLRVKEYGIFRSTAWSQTR